MRKKQTKKVNYHTSRLFISPFVLPVARSPLLDFSGGWAENRIILGLQWAIFIQYEVNMYAATLGRITWSKLAPESAWERRMLCTKKSASLVTNMRAWMSRDVAIVINPSSHHPNGLERRVHISLTFLLGTTVTIETVRWHSRKRVLSDEGKPLSLKRRMETSWCILKFAVGVTLALAMTPWDN